MVDLSKDGQGNAPLTIFGDVGPYFWSAPWIEALANANVTAGCGAGLYCPAVPVTRAQMAVFLLKSQGIKPPAATGPMFVDVPADYWAAAWIEELAAQGITSGCSADSFCPEAVVTRAQMAVFLIKAKGIPLLAPTGTKFTDVPAGYWAASWIEELAAQGITSGCGANSFCPEGVVTRDQMAVFLVKAFNLPLP